MSYTWTEEHWGQKDVNYRIAKRAFVGKGHDKYWWHVSLYDAVRDLWVRQEGVHASAAEAREWAELLLDEQVVG